MNRGCVRPPSRRHFLLPALLVAVVSSACGNTDDLATCPAGTTCCTDDSKCGGATPRCDPATHGCVECLPDHDNCPAPKQCVPAGGSYHCSAACVSDRECGKLGASFRCCQSQCTDTEADSFNCGACGMACPSPAHAMGACVARFCGLGRCEPGFANCDKVDDNGCETTTDTDLKNCGSCGHSCALPNATSTCAAGKCAVRTCVGQNLDCDGQADNGCEANPTSDPLNCGGCGMTCPVPANAPAVCKFGQCGIGACNAGFSDCNRLPGDGCEASLSDDISNCGVCGRRCVADHGLPACKNGACQVTSCMVPFSDCNQMAQDGCEVDLSGDSRNCGACNNACIAVTHGMPGCTAGVCGVGACDAGFGDCDKMPGNGCETDVTSLSNCGACSIACPVPPNATAACKSGVCGIGMCKSQQFLDCDKMPGNGCESDITTDVANCGMCGLSCSYPNAKGTCQNSKCSMGPCNQGFTDCDMQPFNGCEALLNIDSRNCGKCGNACINNAPCMGGQCQPTCNDTMQNAAETDVDCGGGKCPPCGGGKMCLVGGDCVSGICNANKCAPKLDFLPSVNIGLGLTPYQPSIVDLNADARLDVAVGTTDIMNSSKGTITAFLGKGDGTFQAPKVTVTTGIGALASADFDKDGRMDVAVNCSGSELRMALGNGDGTFQMPGAPAVPMSALTAVDFDGDTWMDVFGLDFKQNRFIGNQFAVALNNRSGAFNQAIEFPTAELPSAYAVGDLDGDKQLDAVVGTSAVVGCNPCPLHITTFLNRGGGVLQSVNTYTTPTFPRGLALGDLNNDGKPDLVAVGLNDVTSYLGDGKGGFGAPSAWQGGDLSNVALADYDGDGNLDAAVGDYNAMANNLRVFLGRGDGTLRAPATYTTCQGLQYLASGDLNGDKKPDIVVSCYTAPSLGVLINATK